MTGMSTSHEETVVTSSANLRKFSYDVSHYTCYVGLDFHSNRLPTGCEKTSDRKLLKSDLSLKG